MSRPPSRTERARHLVLTLSAAVIGGSALGVPGFPAGWLSGAIVATSALALAKRPVYIPDLLARAVFVLLGISLGAAVTPDTLNRMAAWPASLVALAVAMMGVTFGTAGYLRLVHRWDPLAALFASAPGALSQALLLAIETKTDVRPVAAVQSVRLLVLIVILPIALVVLGISAPAPTPAMIGSDALFNAPGELALLLVICSTAAYAAQRVRLPGGLIVGSMTASGIVHGSGLIHASMPPAIAIACFVIMGAMIGTRFAGTDLASLRQMLFAGLGALATGTAIAVGTALTVSATLSLDIADVIVAFAPGGLEAMIILSFAMNLDPAYVGAHHLARFLIVSLVLPVAAAHYARRRAPPIPPRAPGA